MNFLRMIRFHAGKGGGELSSDESKIKGCNMTKLTNNCYIKVTSIMVMEEFIRRGVHSPEGGFALDSR